MTLVARTINITPGGDGKLRSYDPKGNFLNSIAQSSSTIPAVSVTSSSGQIKAKGTTFTLTATSTQSGRWSLKSAVDAMFLVPAVDGLSCTVTWVIPAGIIGRSFHVGVKCENDGGSDIAYDLVHVGHASASNIITVGSGQDYATLTLAFAAMSAGDTIVIVDGTYTSDDMRIWYDGGMTHQPVNGVYTTGTDNDGTGDYDTYDFTQYTTIMAATPLGYKFDGQGTANTGCDFYGDTPLRPYEATQFTAPAAGNASRRGIVVAGFHVYDTVGETFTTQRCDHIFFEYCLSIDAGKANVTTAVNVSNFNHAHGQFCGVWYCAAAGMGRYKYTDYQSIDCVFMRNVGRPDHKIGTDPMGGMNPYTSRKVALVNNIILDGDCSEWWEEDNYIPNAFLIAATGLRAYPDECTYRGCVALNNHYLYSQNDAGDSLQTKDTLTWAHGFCWDSFAATANIGAGDFVNDLTTGGPGYFNNMTYGEIDSNAAVESGSAYAFNAFANVLHHAKCILYNYGDPGESAANQGHIGYSSSTDFSFTDSVNYGYTGSSKYLGNYPAEFDLTNLDEATNPLTNGLEYLGRIEIGSYLATAAADGSAIGCTDFWKAWGSPGDFYGDIDFDTPVVFDWTDRILQEEIAAAFRAYTFTGTTRTLGIQTLSGDRGFAVTSQALSDYIVGYIGNTPYPPHVNLSTVGTTLLVSWKHLASAYKADIDNWEVVINGEIADTVEVATHSCEFQNMVSGYTYSIGVRVKDSTNGDSAVSDLYTVTV